MRLRQFGPHRRIHQSSLRTLLLLGVLLSALGCPRKGTVRITDGSTADSLVFRLSTWAYALEVRPCGVAPVWGVDTTRYKEVAWSIVADTTWDSKHDHDIRYAQAPPGFQVLAGPVTLEPGCYWVSYDAWPGRAAFTIDSTSRVHGIKWADSLAGSH